MWILLTLLACTDTGSDKASDSAAATSTTGAGCPDGSLLRIDWVDDDPLQTFVSDTRLVVTPGVERVRGTNTSGWSVQLEHDEEGHLIRRVWSYPDGRQPIESFTWTGSVLQQVVVQDGETLTESSFAFDGDRPIQMVDGELEVVSLFSWSPTGCLTGIGTAIDDRGDPTAVRRQACDDDGRVDAWRSNLGPGAWGGPWEPDDLSIRAPRDGVGGRPTATTREGQPWFTLSWWPDGQLKERDDARCGTGFGEVHRYDADGTLVSTRTQPCPGDDGVVPPADDTTWSVESCF